MSTIAVIVYGVAALVVAALTCVGLIALGASTAIGGLVFFAMLFGAFYLGAKLEIGGP